jgi:hypothetical protein
MFEKIGNMAEKLATNISESRRGLLVRLGKAGLSAAGRQVAVFCRYGT